MIGIISFGVHIFLPKQSILPKNVSRGARSPSLVSKTGPKRIAMGDANIKGQMTDVRDL